MPRSIAWVLAVAVFVSTLAAEPVLVISNELGTSLSTVDAATGSVGTYHTGLNNPDGLMFVPNGNLYATSFTQGTFNRITSATTFETIASGMDGSAGFERDAAGNFFVANFGAPSGGGTTVSRITTGGSLTVNFATGLSTPDDVIFNQMGTSLYVSEWGGHRIRQIDPATGAVTPFVGEESGAGLNLPSAMALDAAGNLYVTNWGNATVSRIAPDGTVTNNYATGVPNSFGLLLDEPGGFFYATGYNTGNVVRFPFAGGPATTIASGLTGPTFLAINPIPESSSLRLVCSLVFVAACLTRLNSRKQLRAAN